MIIVVRHFYSNGQVSLFKQLYVLCSVLFLQYNIYALWEFMMVLIFCKHLYLLFTTFLLNNLQNLWYVGKCIFTRFRNILPILVFTFLLYDGLDQIMFLFRCFLLLVAFIIACYWGVCLYLELSNASCYRVTVSMNISLDEDSFCFPYNPQIKRGLLCLNEKLDIAAYKYQDLRNKRTEIVSKAWHQLKYAPTTFDTKDWDDVRLIETCMLWFFCSPLYFILLVKRLC